ncbi:hypothetical protein [Streptomyces canus]
MVLRAGSGVGQFDLVGSVIRVYKDIRPEIADARLFRWASGP